MNLRLDGLRTNRMAPGRSARPSTLRQVAGLVALLALAIAGCSPGPSRDEDFARVMNTGKNYLDRGQAEKAIPLFAQAVAQQPTRPDARLNLAIAHLEAGHPEAALEHAREVLDYDRNSASAYYVAGCALMRLRQFEPALQMLQPSHDLDSNVAAVHYQIARAHQELGHHDEAIQSYQETLRLEPNHPVAHYALSQVLMRAGQQEEALQAIEKHKAIQAQGTGAPATPETYERCKHTQARAPTPILRPDPQGVKILFTDATSAALGSDARRYHGPLAVLDFNRDDRNSLFVCEATNGFRVLANQAGKFTPLGDLIAANPSGCRRILVGDLNNDRFEDVLALGERASYAYRFATNGASRDVTAAAGLRGLVATDGGFVDLDFTGKLDLLAVLPQDGGLRLLRNLGNMYFKDVTATSGVPAAVTGARQLVLDDWNNDDLIDVFVARSSEAPLYLEKERGGPLVPTHLPPAVGTGTVMAAGDINGDSRVDLLLGSADHLDCLLGGIHQSHRLPWNLPAPARLCLIDIDNDGWLDLLAIGNRTLLWRNLGDARFADITAKTGLDRLSAVPIDDVAAADFDGDCDTDLVFSVPGEGLRFLRNEGGNANHQIKLRLIGNRSNASGLGIRIEVAAGGFRIHRTVSSLPVEIGVGQHDRLDSLTARWFDLAFNQVDLETKCESALPVFEPVLPTGSCPYLYAWDGRQFRFITDILGSAPMGLRVTETVFADADPHELVWLGEEHQFPPRAGHLVVQITEELREVLYLDHAELVVVDHPPDTEVYPTDKFRPSKPFPPGALWTLNHRYPLRRAARLDGLDVTDALQLADSRMVSPECLRIPQLRGLAEPHGVILDFGPLAIDRPLVLALTGWLRFGGGMANVAASQDPDLPFPFPSLEVEVAPDRWQSLDVVVGAPSGKTKTILVDLAGTLPPRSQRLRLKTAFEIHWDRIALFDRAADSSTRITQLAPADTDLHWRGYSEFKDLPWTQPLTPDYDRVFGRPHWSITPTGWCTRYGRVDELVAAQDNALVLLNGGDELTIRFDAASLPAKAEGATRDFFLRTVGWDKDADFHVELGWKVEPLPWHGMDDQQYGRQPRPPFPSDTLMSRYTTRWVGQPTLQRAAR